MSGLIALLIGRGQPITMFIYHLKCLNNLKASSEASMATMIGALNAGLLIDSIEVPKHK